MDGWDRGERVTGPWQEAFEATTDFDLPQALLAVISDDEFGEPEVMRRRYTDHEHVDDVLVVRVASEDRQLAAGRAAA